MSNPLVAELQKMNAQFDETIGDPEVMVELTKLAGKIQPLSDLVMKFVLHGNDLQSLQVQHIATQLAVAAIEKGEKADGLPEACVGLAKKIVALSKE